jgi:hypothetical protein
MDRGRIVQDRARRGLICAALLLAVIVLAGCGGGGGAGSTTASAEVRFLGSAKAVCTDFNVRALALLKVVGGPRVERSANPQLERRQALRERELAELRAVPSAPGQQHLYAAFLSDLAEESRAFASLVNVSGSSGVQDFDKFKAASELGPRLAAKTRSQARALGLEVCARDLVFARGAISG